MGGGAWLPVMGNDSASPRVGTICTDKLRHSGLAQRATYHTIVDKELYLVPGTFYGTYL